MNNRNINKSAALALALCALASPGARAMELGKIVIYSHLSEPLNASVLLGSASGRSAAGIQARVASIETYAAAGIKRPAWADKAMLVPRMIDKGGMELKILTVEPIDAPASSLIIEVTLVGDDRSMAREYAVILDPAEQSKAMAMGSKAAAVSSGRVPNGAASQAGSKSGDELVVRSGQVLYAIAASKKPEGVSVERMMIGVLRANPSAFVSGNINRLKAGAILRMPASPELEAVKQAEAVAQVNQQAGEFAKWRSAALARVAPIDSKASGSSASGKIAPMGSSPDPSDVLRLGKPGSTVSKPGDGADAISKKREIEESKSKVQDLERMKADLQKLLTIKDKQLADAQSAAKKPEVKPEVKPEAKPEVKPEVKPEAKPEAKPEVKPEAKPEAAPEVKPEASPEAAASEVKPEEAKPIVAPIAPPVVARPKPVVVPKPVVPEPTVGGQVMGAVDAYGLYLAGVLAAMVAAAALLVAKKRKGKLKMMSTTISPDRDEGGELDAKGSAPSDLEERINAADTYIAFEQPDKATKELEAALAMSPANPEALIRLARIASKKKDRSELGRVAGEIGDATFKTGPYWDEAEALLGQFAKVADAKPVGVAPPQIDLTLDLERSLMDLAAETPKEPGPTHDMDFIVNLDSGIASAAHPAPTVGAEPVFDLPSFDVPSSAAVPVHAEPELREPVHYAVPKLDSFSFDMGLPDDKSPSTLSSSSDSFSMDTALAEPASEAENELSTMLELAKAYVEMGDKEGAKELLVEIAQKGNAAQSSQAKAILADL